jgi:hypothetical protein
MVSLTPASRGFGVSPYTWLALSTSLTFYWRVYCDWRTFLKSPCDVSWIVRSHSSSIPSMNYWRISPQPYSFSKESPYFICLISQGKSTDCSKDLTLRLESLMSWKDVFLTLKLNWTLPAPSPKFHIWIVLAELTSPSSNKYSKLQSRSPAPSLSP